MLFRLRYALHLWWNVPDLSILEALRYPMDRETFPNESPEGLAASEISYMGEI